MTGTVVDGRRLRRTENREAVLDAMAELFEAGVYQPRAHEIALRAGISPRSLFRYFDDVDDLSRAAIERQLDAARPLVDVAVAMDAPLAERADAVAAARVRLFDAVAPAARAARACAPRHAVVARQVAAARRTLRAQLESLFAPELRARPNALGAVDVLCSFESYEILRVEHRLPRPRVVATLTEAIMAVLGSGEDTDVRPR